MTDITSVRLLMRWEYDYERVDGPLAEALASHAWIVPPRRQGQIVEVAFAEPYGLDAGEGSPWMRVTDRSLDLGDPERVTYYQLIEGEHDD